MEQSTKLGTNKTGIDMSPILSKQMTATDGLTSMTQRASMTQRDVPGFMEFENLCREDADPLGSVPLPGTVKGVVKSTAKMLTGHHPEVFINKLGERLAYERCGVRIYEQLILKCRNAAASDLGEKNIPLERLIEFRDQEEDHFHMLVECLETLGADPTAQTPDADASGVASMGLMKVITDPRTSVSQSLEAMLSLELTDNAAWELLISLAEDMGMSDMALRFQGALADENIHLEQVKAWYQDSVRTQAKVTLAS